MNEAWPGRAAPAPCLEAEPVRKAGRNGLRRWLQVFIVVFAAAYALAPAQAAEPRAARIDALLWQWNRSDSPGAMVAVVENGEIVFAHDYGMADLEQGVPIRAETTFSLASMSKQFAAAAVALLAEQGRLKLDDDVRRYIPELPDYGHRITVSDLVHHTSGLRDYLQLWGLSGRAMTDSMPEDQILDLIARQKALNYVPGERYLYSNTGYQLISLLVHRASGQPLSTFAEKNLFAPLGMRHTHFHDDITRLVPFNAAPYARRDGGGFALVRTQVALVGAGKAYSTVGDLALWDANFYANRLGKGGPALIRQLQTTARLNDGKSIEYAFGLNVTHYRGLEAVRHSGASTGISTSMIRFPGQRVSVIVLGNVAQLGASALSERIADIWLDGHFSEPVPDHGQGKPDPTLAPATALRPDAALTAALAGDYYSEELDTIYRLEAQGTALAAYAGGARHRYALVPLEEDRFRLEDGEGDAASGRFLRGADGTPQGFVLDAGAIHGLRFVKRAR